MACCIALASISNVACMIMQRMCRIPHDSMVQELVVSAGRQHLFKTVLERPAPEIHRGRLVAVSGEVAAQWSMHSARP